MGMRKRNVNSSEFYISKGLQDNIWFVIFIAIATGIVSTIISNILIHRYDTQYYSHRYDDSLLMENIEEDLAEDGSSFQITQLAKADLHGLDHNSLIISGYELSSIDGQVTLPKAKLAIYEKPEEDYSAVFEVQGVSTDKPKRDVPSSVQFEVADINYDGRSEILFVCNDNSPTSAECYAAIIGWDNEYKVLWTLPVLNYYSDEYCINELIKANIELFGYDISNGTETPEFEDYDPGITLTIKQGKDTQKFSLGNSSHIQLMNIDNDPYIEILCADFIWAYNECHLEDHSYFIRVYEMPGSWKGGSMYETRSDPYWNQGQPLLFVKRQPFLDFLFTDEILSAGENRFQENDKTQYGK